LEDNNDEIFEIALLNLFSNYHYQGEKWIVQKRVNWSKRGIPLRDLSFSDYEYKIRLDSQKTKVELFKYYTLEIRDTGILEIDCMNIRVGFGHRRYMSIPVKLTHLFLKGLTHLFL